MKKKKTKKKKKKNYPWKIWTLPEISKKVLEISAQIYTGDSREDWCSCSVLQAHFRTQVCLEEAPSKNPACRKQKKTQKRQRWSLGEPSGSLAWSAAYLPGHVPKICLKHRTTRKRFSEKASEKPTTIRKWNNFVLNNHIKSAVATKIKHVFPSFLMRKKDWPEKSYTLEKSNKLQLICTHLLAWAYLLEGSHIAHNGF